MMKDDAIYMTGTERMRLRHAAFCAARVYPGPVGQLISTELLSWEEFGWRFGGKSRVMDIANHVMDSYKEAA